MDTKISVLLITFFLKIGDSDTAIVSHNIIFTAACQFLIHQNLHPLKLFLIEYQHLHFKLLFYSFQAGSLQPP